MSTKNEPNTVTCPVCSREVSEKAINQHLDNACRDPEPSFKIKGHGHGRTASTSQIRKHDSLAPIFSLTPEVSNRTAILTLGDSTIGSSSTSRKRKPEHLSGPTLDGSTKRGKTGSQNLQSAAPLAERLRPTSLDEFIGQSHLLGPGSLMRNMLDTGSIGSMIFWGPPGCGKTSLARLLAKQTDATFRELSATVVGISDVRAVFEEAKGTLSLTRRRTVLFLDEVHRFNKAQQDIFLPYLEQGYIQLIGATTENPSFKLTGALLSRCRVFVLERLTDENIEQIIHKAVARVVKFRTPSELSEGFYSSQSEPSTSQPPIPESSTSPPLTPSTSENLLYVSLPQLTQKVLSSITSLSAGDARTALSLLELVLVSPKNSKECDLLTSLRRSVAASYDRTGDSHYDMISALHKSVRGSQGSAAMYWLARMLVAGEDPLYIARRMVVCASEDIGLADNHALPLAIATFHACQTIGMPECRINLAHLVAYLSEAPKSTRAYEAYKRAEEAANLDLTIPVPLPMRNAPTGLMKDLGYARGYSYNPDYAHPVHNDYLPIQFRGESFLKEAGDRSGKIWDNDALVRWENEENGGRDWEGRPAREP